jgi:molecular chaperone IbpA
MSKHSYPMDLQQFLVGFNQVFDDFEKSFDKTSKFPPHDIVRLNENKYQIIIAVAGFGRSDIDITLESNFLVVKGAKIKTVEDYETQPVYLYNGISKRSFEKKFQLRDNLRVQSASVSDGMLVIDLETIVPEDKKPLKIAIN